jgi:hypothetical protein
LEIFYNGVRGDGRHRRKPEGGVNGKFTNQSSRWGASEMDHSPKGEAVGAAESMEVVGAADMDGKPER